MFDKAYFDAKDEEELKRALVIIAASTRITGQLNNIAPMVLVRVMRTIADDMEVELDKFIEKLNNGEITLPNYG